MQFVFLSNFCNVFDRLFSPFEQMKLAEISKQNALAEIGTAY
tara:strand:+ start:194 stop:319 length:126 start_codon:yes stop_codon:yes gene_type:complete